jgi:hypothetical protein
MAQDHPADAAFLVILPTLVRHANVHLRFVRCRHEFEDLLQEVLAYGFKWTRLLWDRGKDVREFRTALATYAVLAVRQGRRLCGMNKASDAMNRVTQTRLQFFCERLPDRESHADNCFADALTNNTRSEIPEQVAFRIDFPTWLASCAPRDQAIICDMMSSEGSGALAARYRLSPARISQLRREYHRNWLAFMGEGTSKQRLHARTISACV